MFYDDPASDNRHSAKGETSKIKREVEKAKTRIAQINENLKMELGSYSKNRGESLKRLMGHHCYAEQMKAKKSEELAEEAAKEFPLIEFDPDPVPFSIQEKAREEERKGESGSEALDDLSAEDVA